MSRFPRAALGYLGNSSAGRYLSSSPMAWALAGYLVARGKQVRHFRARACYCGPQGAHADDGKSLSPS
ncbi:MAG: hypothetical protein QM775_26045 [Pirellulales bacterium]